MKKRNRNLKRFLSLLLVMVMAMSQLSLTAFAAELDEDGDPAPVSETAEAPDTGTDAAVDDADAAVPETAEEAGTDAGEEGSTDAAEPGDEADPDTGAADEAEAEEPGDEDADAAAEAGGAEEPADAEADTDDGDAGEEPADAADEPFDLTKTERDPASDDVTATIGDDGEKDAEAEKWDVFYDADTDTYKITFNIGADADAFDQTIDLTEALRKLSEYAATAEKPEEPPVPAGSEVSEEDMAAYEAEKAEYDSNIAYICRLYNNFNSPSGDSGKAEAILAEKSLEEFCDEMMDGLGWIGFDETDVAMIMNPPQKPEPSVDTDSPEYQAYLIAKAEYDAAMAEYKLRAEADVLQPGDARKFELFITSDSKHTYKYQSGSFTLATGDLSELYDADSGVFGFDGQELSAPHVREVHAGVNWMSDAMSALAKEAGIPRSEAFYLNGEDMLDVLAGNAWHAYLTDKQIDDLASVLGIEKTAGAEECRSAIEGWLVKYYGEADGIEYADLADVLARSDYAKTDITGPDTNNKYATVGGEALEFTFANGYLYDTFYKSLLSFAFGDSADVDAILGEATQMADGRWEYANQDWKDGDNQYAMALYYYMSHGEIWQQTDAYFQMLLDAGLNNDQATWKSLTMALQIAGKATGNNWQNTEWPWYSSIKLDRVDFEFTLTKTDENGNPITSDPAGFQLWYVNAKGEEVYLAQEFDADGNPVRDEAGKPVFYETTDPTTIRTENGTLEVLYAMTTDKVFYLKETEAPAGYEIDPTVYVIGGAGDDAYLEDMKARATADIQKQIDDLMTDEYATNKKAVEKLQKEIKAFMAADGTTAEDLVAYVAELNGRLADLRAEGMNIQDLETAISDAAGEFEAAKAALEEAEAAVNAKHETVAAEIDRLNGELDSVKNEFNALKAEYEASTDVAARNEMIEKMNALQAKAELLSENMAAVKAAYDADAVHDAYKSALLDAEAAKGKHNGYADALNGILGSDDYKALQDRINAVRELQEAKAALDASENAAEIKVLENQLKTEADRLFKDIAKLQKDESFDWTGALKLEVYLENRKAIEEGTYIVPELPDAADTVDVTPTEKPVLPDADDVEFDIPDPEPPKDPEPDPEPPTPPDDPPEEPPEEPDIPDEPPPLSDVPPEEPPHEDPPPEVDIPEEEPPLSDVPEEDVPEEEEDIPDEDIPLSDIPQTGDDTSLAVYYVLAVTCAMGLCYIAVTGKKRDELQ